MQKDVDSREFFNMFCFIAIGMILLRPVFHIFLSMRSDLGIYYSCDIYDIPYYAVNYDNGLIIRGLAGELFGKFLLGFGDNFAVAIIVLKMIYTLVFCVMLIIFAKRYVTADPKLCAMICVMFMRPWYLNSAISYCAKPDIYWYLCMIPIVLCLWSNEEKYFNIKMIAVILFSFVAMLFHHSFIFIFAPLICAFLIEKKHYKWFVIYGCFMCAVFIFLIKFCTGDYETILDQVNSNLDNAGLLDVLNSLPHVMRGEDGNFAGLYYEYGTDRATQLYHSEMLMSRYFADHIPIFGIQMSLSVLSLIVTFRVISIYCKTVLNNKWLSRLLAVIFILPFLALLIFTIDVDRWALQTLTGLNIFAIYLAKKYDIKIDMSLDTFGKMFIAQGLSAIYLCYIS